MAQRHLDRLSAIDATFLHQEDEASHMHIGGVVILDGPPPTYEEFCGLLERRLHRVPRYRQKLAFPPAQTGRPLWIDDPHFQIEFHVRHCAVPRPGREEQLLRLTAQVFSQRLDRRKPLWEMWLVEGLSGGRWAVIGKSHHCLIDGVSGADLLTVLFDLTPTPPPEPEPPPWRPHPEPSPLELLLAGVRDAAGAAVGLSEKARSAVLRPPSALVHSLREAIQGLGEVALTLATPAPETPLNVPIGPHRRFAAVHARLEDFKLVKNVFGGTVNDVVLAVVAGAIRRLLRHRGVRTEGLVLRVLVPVSTRASEERGALGNRITVMVAPLPVHLADPIDRLHEVTAAMAHLKQSKQAVGADIIANLQAFAPPTLLAQSSRLAMSSRVYNLLVTNVPGPQFPVYCLGRRLREVIPVPFLAPDHALAIAVMSYDGTIDFGLLGDYDAMHDLDVVRDGVAEELQRLVSLARQRLEAETEIVAKPAVGRAVANGRARRPSRAPREPSGRERGGRPPQHASTTSPRGSRR